MFYNETRTVNNRAEHLELYNYDANWLRFGSKSVDTYHGVAAFSGGAFDDMRGIGWKYIVYNGDRYPGFPPCYYLRELTPPTNDGETATSTSSN